MRLLPRSLDPGAGRQRAVHHHHQRGRALDHRAVDDLALAGRAGADDAGQHAHREIQRAAAEIADQVQRRHRRPARRADRIQRARQRDVVDVVPGGMRDRPVLAPAGHPAVDQLRVAREADIGGEAEPLHDPRPKPLDQRVGPVDQPQHRRDRVRVFQIDRDVAAAALQQPEARVLALAADVAPDIGGAIDPDHLGAHVGQQHRAKRRRADAGQLDDFHPLKRSHLAFLPLRAAQSIMRGRRHPHPDPPRQREGG